MGRNMQLKQTKTREVFVPFRLKPNQARGRGELGKMIKANQIEKKHTREVFVPFRLKPNQARGKEELVKMLKTKQVEKEQVRGNLGEQIRLRTNTASLMSCGVSSQSEVAIQIASQRVADRFSPKRSGTKKIERS